MSRNMMQKMNPNRRNFSANPEMAEIIMREKTKEIDERHLSQYAPGKGIKQRIRNAETLKEEGEERAERMKKKKQDQIVDKLLRKRKW